MNWRGEHYVVTSYYTINYYKDNVACGNEDKWTSATLRAGNTLYVFETEDEVNHAIALLSHGYAAGNRDKAKAICKELGI